MSNEFNPEGPFLVTTFINKTDKEWHIREKGRLIFTVFPGETQTLASWRTDTEWARWESAVADKKKGIVLTPNPRWESPWPDAIVLEAENIDGASIENLAVLGEYVHVQRGMPMQIPLNLFDPLCQYSKLTWKKRSVRKPIAGTKYFETSEELFLEKTPRDKKEVNKIYEERMKVLAERLEKEEKAKLQMKE